MTILQRLLLFAASAIALLVACVLGLTVTINRLYMCPIETLSNGITVGDRYDDVVAILDDYADVRETREWFGYRFIYTKEKDDIYIGYINGFDGSNLEITFDDTGHVTANRYFRD